MNRTDNIMQNIVLETTKFNLQQISLPSVFAQTTKVITKQNSFDWKPSKSTDPPRSRP